MYFIIEIQANKTGEQAAIVQPIPGYTDKDKAISAFAPIINRTAIKINCAFSIISYRPLFRRL